MIAEESFLQILADLVDQCFFEKEELEKILLIPDHEHHDASKQVSMFEAFLSSKKSDKFKKEKMERHRKGYYRLLIKICKASYELIQLICENNDRNQKLLVKHFDVFKKHVGYKIGAGKCLSAIIQNNVLIRQ